jgi:hypothetical protein
MRIKARRQEEVSEDSEVTLLSKYSRAITTLILRNKQLNFSSFYMLQIYHDESSLMTDS